MLVSIYINCSLEHVVDDVNKLPPPPDTDRFRANLKEEVGKYQEY